MPGSGRGPEWARRRLRRFLLVSGAFDLFAEFAHVVEGPARRPFCDEAALVARAVGIVARRGRRCFADVHIRRILQRPDLLRIDVGLESAGVGTPFPNRLATVIKRDAARGRGLWIVLRRFAHVPYSFREEYVTRRSDIFRSRGGAHCEVLHRRSAAQHSRCGNCVRIDCNVGRTS